MKALPTPDPKAGWKAQEKRAAKIIRGKPTAGSGNSKRVSHKGDAVSDLVRCEAKTTIGASLSVKKEWLAKIRREAFETNKIPALVFGFDAVATPREDWMAFPVEVASVLLRVADLVERRDYEQARAWVMHAKGGSDA